MIDLQCLAAMALYKNDQLITAMHPADAERLESEIEAMLKIINDSNRVEK